MRDADNYITYLESELATTTVVDTRIAVSRLLEAQIKQRMTAKVTREYALRIVDGGIIPDADDPVRPKKVQMFLLGPVIGLVLGIGYVLLAWALGGTGPRSGSPDRRNTATA
jgi:capsular polysaccharide biosynthesis protein